MFGGLYTVVMEYLDGETVWKKKETDKTPLPLSLYNDVEAAIKILHQANIVFGNLRMGNIMCVSVVTSEVAGGTVPARKAGGL